VPKVEASEVEPIFDTEKSVVVADAVEDPIANSVVAVSPLLAATENLANGELVPRPTCLKSEAGTGSRLLAGCQREDHLC